MLRRNGRNDLALPEFAAAIAGLTERDAPRDLVKALNNRGILHLEAGHISAAHEDLARGRRLAIRHGLDWSAALALLNRACLEAVAGDFPGRCGRSRSRAPNSNLDAIEAKPDR
jgi:hypothetical protein